MLTMVQAVAHPRAAGVGEGHEGPMSSGSPKYYNEKDLEAVMASS